MEGSLTISLIDLRGLILPSERNRSKQNLKDRLDPVVELTLETLTG